MSEPNPDPRSSALPPGPRRQAFGEFELDPVSGELHRGGEVIHLEPQPAKVLLFLLERAGQVVRRKELHRHVWGETRHVEADQGLNYCIKELRHALGDSAREPTYIETLRRRGYRFLVPASAAGDAPDEVGGAAPPASGHGDGGTLRRWGGGLLGSGALEAAVLLVLLLAALGLRAAMPAGGTGGATVGGARAVRIAVLPFEACGRDDETLTRGLPATVISRLAARAPAGFEVVAATSSFAYQGRSRTAREIGRELRVSYVVEGTFHRAGVEARLDVRLVDTEEDAVVWTGSYDADAARLDALAGTLAEAVAGAVHPGAPEARVAAR